MPPDRRLTTIVAADVAGYSRLVSRDEEGTIDRFRTLRAALVDPQIRDAGGRIVKTMGDGLLVEFGSPVAALRAVTAVQTAMVGDQAGHPEDQRIRFRVGINLGDVVVDGDDILGDGVNIAARLESLAAPGGICISRAVHDQVQGRTDAVLTPLGLHSVKNIPHPVEVWRVEVDGVAAAPVHEVKPADRPGLVVLPFDNMSADPDQDFLADGLVEDVTTELSRFRTLSVIARNTAFAYKGMRRDVRQIAAELGVAYVVEGSVRRAGQRLRITAQLIDAATGAHLWADRWDRTMDDLFAVQDEMTAAIVTGVEPELGAHERAAARRKPTESLTAWELCQRGYGEVLTYTDDGIRSGVEMLHRAIIADPDFALPHACLARAQWIGIISGRSLDPAADIRLGIGHAQAALALDDRLENALAALGFMLAMAGRSEDAARAVDRGVALNPNNALLHHARGIACMHQPEPDTDVMEQAELIAIRLSPKDPSQWAFWFTLGTARFLRNLDMADGPMLEAFETATRLPHADYFAFLVMALMRAEAGNTGEAGHFLAEALKRNPRLTAASWRGAFHFPAFARISARTDPALHRLIALGLPAA